MKYEKLLEINRQILHTEFCSGESLPVINELKPSQRYLIISSDPSLDTDKTKHTLARHSSFEERVISFVFFGSEDRESLEKVRSNYSRYKEQFLNHFYWTHYSKCYSKGKPDRYWADKFLKQEVAFFEPELIIIFGNKPADFLFGKGKLENRVNKVLEWEGVPVICCLHPSRNWNIQRREEYKFEDTWVLIRAKIKLD